MRKSYSHLPAKFSAAAIGPFCFLSVFSQPALEQLDPVPPVSPATIQPLLGPDGLPLDPVDRNRLAAPQNATSVYAAGAPRSGRVVETPFRLGPVRVRPHADYMFTYGNGVSTSPGSRHTTAQHRLSPGVSLETEHLSLDYTPSLNYYSNEAFEDHLDHAVFLAAGYALSDWDFRLTQSYSNSRTPLVETGGQTLQETFVTALGATYRYHDKVSIELGLDQRIQSAQEFNSSREWSTTDWVNYHFTEDTFAGVGVSFGYVDVTRSSDMTYEQLLGKVSSRFTEKLSGEVSGGVEVRQFLDEEDGSDRVNPIMNARLTYIPWEPTIVSILASRSVETSLFEGFVTESTQVQLMVQQRLLGRFFLDIDAGYRQGDMEGGTLVDQVGRSDELTNLSVALRANVLTRGSASVFYRHSDNSSTVDLYSFNSDQYGFQIGYRF